MGDGGPKAPGSLRRLRAVQALAVALALVLTGLGTYVLFVRNWSADDLQRAVIDDPSPASPGFRHNLAGRNVVVEGTVTNITSKSTTIGILSLVELDDNPYVPIAVWGIPDYRVGDHLEKKIKFEWSNCNKERHVYSPDLAFPALQTIPSVELVSRATNYVSGSIDLESWQLENGDIRVDVPYVRDPVPVLESNCTLKEGEHSWAAEYIDVLGFYPKNPVIDEMENLAFGISRNRTVQFVDSNSDQYLDSGDYFLLKNLTRPATESGINTYFLTIGWPIEPEMSTYEWGFSFSYVPLIKKGLVRYDRGDAPGVRMTAIVAGDGFQYEVRTVYGFLPDWSNISFGISASGWERAELNISESQLTGYPMATEMLPEATVGGLNLDTEVFDLAGDGRLGVGDRITVSTPSGHFPANSSYALQLTYKPMGTWIWSTELLPNATPTCRLDVNSVSSGLELRFNPVHIGFNQSYSPFDLPWDEVRIGLSDGNDTVNWTLDSVLLSSGIGERVALPTLTLGGLTVVCNVTDVEGNGLVNRGDTIELTTTGVERFSPMVEYTLHITYKPSASLMCNVTFSG